MNYRIVTTQSENKFQRRLDNFLRFTGLATIFGFIFIVIGGYYAANWLLVNETPVEADAIVVLAGQFSRPFHGADLYKKGFAKKIYLSRPVKSKNRQHLEPLGIELPVEEEINVQILTKKGVDKNAITLYGNGLVSTLDEAETLYKTITPAPKRLLVVTSPTHTRRAKIIFADVFKETEILAIATPYEDFPKKWWTDRNTAVSVVLEAAKTLYYRLGGGFRAQNN